MNRLHGSATPHIVEPHDRLWSQMPRFPARRWAVTAIAAGVAGVLMGAPTDLVPNGLFQRMTPAVWWNYPVWIVSALLLGLIAGTYVRSNEASARRAHATPVLGGGFVSVLAVGCPVCNKLVVLALGSSGALSYFGPVQPILGVAAVGLLALALRARLRTVRACAVRPHSP